MNHITFLSIIAVVSALLLRTAFGQDLREQGVYFGKNNYLHRTLPAFDSTKTLLPQPVFDENPLLVEAYWKTWELAFRNFHQPVAGSGLVSNFADAAFNANIFFWDTAFMTMFLNTAHELVPGIQSLDNFYAKQYADGEICREINRTTGIDFEPWLNKENLPLFSRWGFNDPAHQLNVPIRYSGRAVPIPNPHLTLDALNHPVAAWAELESFRWTADTTRINLVYLPLVKYYQAFQKYLRQGNGLYITDWASMDNSPRNPCLTGGGTGIDISAGMVLFARNLAEMAEITGRPEEARQFQKAADSLAALINKKMWDENKKFYFDLTAGEEKCTIKTIAAFWTLVSKTATQEQAKQLAAHLQNPQTFGRLHSVPTLSADEPGYVSRGGYWSGAVWIATNTMVLKGLEEYGFHDLARDIALRHIAAMAEVYKKTGTIWENYAADSIAFGRHGDGNPVLPDFVGFSGVTPILHFLTYAIGLQPDAPNNRLHWEINSSKTVGCRQFQFNGHLVDLLAEPEGNVITITVETDGAFELELETRNNRQMVSVIKGHNQYQLATPVR